MNKTIRNETHKLVLKFLCANNLGEHSSQQIFAAEFHHVAHIQNNFNGDKEMLQLPPLANNLARRQSILTIKHSKIVPKQSILEP